LAGLGEGFAQGTGSLGGLVTDGDDKLPLIGVNVVIKGSSLGSSSNLDGRYLLSKIPVGTYQVEVTYLGYEKKILRVYESVPTKQKPSTSSCVDRR